MIFRKPNARFQRIHNDVPRSNKLIGQFQYYWSSSEQNNNGLHYTTIKHDVLKLLILPHVILKITELLLNTINLNIKLHTIF